MERMQISEPEARKLLRLRGIEVGLEDPRSVVEIAEQVIRTGSPALVRQTVEIVPVGQEIVFVNHKGARNE